MASTCGSCLALMDAGVPITRLLGVLQWDLSKKAIKPLFLPIFRAWKIFLAIWTLKVTGNKEGITALQIDIKIKGIEFETLKKAIENAKAGRIFIIDKMIETISAPRKELSPFGTRIDTMKIDTESIGTVIGPGGKTIRSIIEETGATIDIEDDGTVIITSVSGEGAKKAIRLSISLP